MASTRRVQFSGPTRFTLCLRNHAARDVRHPGHGRARVYCERRRRSPGPASPCPPSQEAIQAVVPAFSRLNPRKQLAFRSRFGNIGRCSARRAGHPSLLSSRPDDKCHHVSPWHRRRRKCKGEEAPPHRRRARSSISTERARFFRRICVIDCGSCTSHHRPRGSNRTTNLFKLFLSDA